MIIGITGPAGAGKDTSANYIAQKLGIKHVSGGDLIRGMLTKLNLEPKKGAVGDFGTFLKVHYGANILVDSALAQIGDDENIVYSGFRAKEVAELIRSRGGIVCYIDSSDQLRHDRIATRQRELDDISSESLKSLDQHEKATNKPMAQNLDEVRLIANVIIVNDGSIKDLFLKIDTEIISQLNI